ncbi:hypothetical protein CPC08DRAFT_706678 [Agrocybe pediades]|nr:hypothetical protein CPC08DRAFT_706678 [Agrocybe pediades]
MQSYSARIPTLQQLSLLPRTSRYTLSNHARLEQTRRNHNDAGAAQSASTPPPQQQQLSGSAKLFADAEVEEREAAEAEAQKKKNKSSRLVQLEQEHENWTGDENVRDAVLRMLVDKYKPLRTGGIQTADDKLKKSPPKIGSAYIGPGTIEPAPQVNLTPKSGSWATEPLLPSKEGHEPWHTVYKAPKHEVSSIKLAQMPSVVSSKPTAVLPLNDRARRLEREQRKRTMRANKLTQARESTLDYKLGLQGGQKAGGARYMPTSMKGWTSMVEDRIEKARKAGQFNNIKGRGKPLERSTEEYNPFIAREEFLMNRIVRKNGAAPPWVEFQVELDTAATAFRDILRQSWMRRAIRVLANEHPTEILHKLTLQDIKRHRDPEWFEKEKSYHEAAVTQLNSLVRKYNGLAPYAVRRPYYSREVEIRRLYEDCAEEILQMISERVYTSSPLGEMNQGGGGRSAGQGSIGGGPASADPGYSLLQWLRELMRRWFGARDTA